MRPNNDVKGTRAPLARNASHNQDINIAKVAVTHEDLVPLFVQMRLFERFKTFDKEARKWKRIHVRLGTVALCVGTLALLGFPVELAASAVPFSLPRFATPAIEFLAILSLALFLIGYLLRAKSKYQLACFQRERLRQWKYQMFLDGEFVDRFVKSSDEAQCAFDEKLDRFIGELTSSFGVMGTFIRESRTAAGLLYKRTPYPDPETAKQVFALLERLRFNYQAAYTETRIADRAEDRKISLREHYHWSENVANFSLLFALLIPIAQLSLMMFASADASYGAHLAHIWLTVAAIACAILSATSRAYRTGLTVPEEIDSYEEYCAKVIALRDQFRNDSASVDTRQRLLEELEVESENELRRFLLMKGKATFLL